MTEEELQQKQEKIHKEIYKRIDMYWDQYNFPMPRWMLARAFGTLAKPLGSLSLILDQMIEAGYIQQSMTTKGGLIYFTSEAFLSASESGTLNDLIYKFENSPMVKAHR